MSDNSQSSVSSTLTMFVNGATVVTVYSAWYLLFFSPAIFSRPLLEPGDSLLYYLPNFLIGLSLWDPLINAGFPVAADPQAMSWYPLSMLFSLLSSWNGFVLSSNVLASSFTHGYVRAITGSRLAALAAGIIYGTSGFLIAHQMHTTIIHAAAWLPLMVWSLDRLRDRTSPAWVVVGCCSVACSVLAGHPQMTIYSLLVCAFYVLVMGWSLPRRRFAYYSTFTAMVSLGLGLTAVQLVPFAELASLGVRVNMTFEQFISYSLSPYQSINMLFPYIFGGSHWSFYKIPYFGQWTIHEITGYVGLLSLMLASVGFLSGRREVLVRFWIAVALVAFVLTLGPPSPVGKLMYYVPVLNKFRAPGRHFLEFTFAVAVLAGLGVAAVQRSLATIRIAGGTVVAGSVLMITGTALIFLYADTLQGIASAKGIPGIEVTPWKNPAVGVPLVVFFMAAASLLLLARSPRSRAAQTLLIIVLALDLGSFGWFQFWKYDLMSPNALGPASTVPRYRALLEHEYQRAAPVKGLLSPADAFPPNLNRLWKVPSIGGYGPMILSRSSRLFSMASNGEMTGTWSGFGDRSLDVAAVRYVFLPSREAKLIPVTDPGGMAWSPEGMNVSLGNGCGVMIPSVTLTLPEEVTATSIGIVSSLSCSTRIRDGDVVAGISISDARGRARTTSLLAGRDTSEWAYDCSDVNPLMNHGRAAIFKSFPVAGRVEQCEGHHYVTTVQNNGPLRVREIKIQWGGAAAAINILNITIFDGSTGTSYVVTPRMGDLANRNRWRHVEDIDGLSVYENLRAMPRAWLVPEVFSAGPEDVIAAVQTSRLPDGRTFDPMQMALIEEPLIRREPADQSAVARVVLLSARRVEVLTETGSPSFLVLSDVNYPGWRATIDGMPVKVYQTNYLFRGVPVPAGSHRIVFEFKPLTYYIGAGISLVSFCIISGILVRSIIARRRKMACSP